ncbi:CBS domain-containing protein [Mucilaginibacter mali]|uniref:histidine kinase n=1 Tax=Mucilaginibacter mali TaxID=2740462 RepID=A0A7D4QK78_9SPHI|nr:ATP-binding protein [Mucilaginibacter mali]QKJ30270.1 CBS domain-containing protein [Mucilaginibacter mali]
MKVINLIDRQVPGASILEDTRVVYMWLIENLYLAIIDEEQRVIGVLTLKDLHHNADALNVIDFDISKPEVSPEQSIFEAFELMKETENDCLPVYDDGKFLGVITMKRITERLVQFVSETQQQYQKVIHDLRNPISNLSSLIKLLDTTVTDQETQEFIKLCTFSCKHAMEILDDLLYVEIDENKPLVKELTELNEFFKICITEQSGLCLLKGIKVETNISNDKFVKEIDRARLKRAIQNVISNAIKFSYPNSTVKMSTKIERNQIILKVLDAGIGIPEIYQNDVFEKFTAAGRIGTNGEPSTGLGLCFSKQCIEQHGGQIYFKSTEGRGTKFYIRL